MIAFGEERPGDRDEWDRRVPSARGDHRFPARGDPKVSEVARNRDHPDRDDA
jgi:hypothetical protein